MERDKSSRLSKQTNATEFSIEQYEHTVIDYQQTIRLWRNDRSRLKSRNYKFVICFLLVIGVVCLGMVGYAVTKFQAKETPVTHHPITANPTASPDSSTNSPTFNPITFVPGKLTVRSNGLLLSEGLECRIVARTGEPVVLNGLKEDKNGMYRVSRDVFHEEPDGAAVFEWLETGGWVYVSNSEVLTPGGGGVSAIYFDKYGKVIDYQHLLKNTTKNCSGGKTPWNTWVSCEEIEYGKIYQVDPFGIREPQVTTMGKEGGSWESFACDMRDENNPRFFVTEDAPRGALLRYTPSTIDLKDQWKMLHDESGVSEYLVLTPNISNENFGTFAWTEILETAKVSAALYYPHTEGIDVYRNELFFTIKERKELFILNLDAMTYEKHSTKHGVFDGTPDQIKRLLNNQGNEELLYFCEEGGAECGVHARDSQGRFFTILESIDLQDETTGLDFSPDGKFMYVSFQHTGIIYEVWRQDKRPFHAKRLDVKYHHIPN